MSKIGVFIEKSQLLFIKFHLQVIIQIMESLVLSSFLSGKLNIISRYSSSILALFLLWWCANSSSNFSKVVPTIACEQWAPNCANWSKISLSKHIEQSLYIIEQVVYIKLQSEKDSFIDFWGYVDLLLKFRIMYWEKKFNEFMFYFDTLLSNCDDMIEETWDFSKYDTLSVLIDNIFIKLSLFIQKNDPLEVESFIDEMKNLWFYYNSVLKSDIDINPTKKLDI